jgi:MGT family glycosyltransferase
VPEALGGAFRGTYVDLAPPSLAGGTAAPARRVEPLRPIPVAPPVDETPPTWLDQLPERPTVAVTLGTVWNAPAVFRLLLDALEPLDVNVVATVGRNVDPEALAPHPPNARVERYVSQALLLPRVHAVVSHGGSGSMLATLAHGLPMLLVPLGADQFDNAERCVEAGLARRLLPDQLDVDSARAAVAAMLEDDDARERAGRAAAEIAEMPGPGEVANRLAGELAPV